MFMTDDHGAWANGCPEIHTPNIDKLAGGGVKFVARSLARDSAGPTAKRWPRFSIELDRILVMGSIEKTAAEGQVAAHTFIGAKSALLCTVGQEETPWLIDPCRSSARMVGNHPSPDRFLITAEGR